MDAYLSEETMPVWLTERLTCKEKCIEKAMKHHTQDDLLLFHPTYAGNSTDPPPQQSQMYVEKKTGKFHLILYPSSNSPECVYKDVFKERLSVDEINYSRTSAF